MRGVFMGEGGRRRQLARASSSRARRPTPTGDLSPNFELRNSPSPTIFRTALAARPMQHCALSALCFMPESKPRVINSDFLLRFPISQGVTGAG